MRQLTETEHWMLGLMLGMDFPGATELRVQVDSARVKRGCDCGCATVDLVVEGDAPRAEDPIPRELPALSDDVYHGLSDPWTRAVSEWAVMQDPEGNEFCVLKADSVTGMT